MQAPYAGRIFATEGHRHLPRHRPRHERWRLPFVLAVAPTIVIESNAEALARTLDHATSPSAPASSSEVLP
jgi:hypothetical protein